MCSYFLDAGEKKAGEAFWGGWTSPFPSYKCAQEVWWRPRAQAKCRKTNRGKDGRNIHTDLRCMLHIQHYSMYSWVLLRWRTEQKGQYPNSHQYERYQVDRSVVPPQWQHLLTGHQSRQCFQLPTQGSVQCCPRIIHFLERIILHWDNIGNEYPHGST